MLSEKFPSVSIPKLRRIDSLPSTKTCDIFYRLTCNLFQSPFSQRSSNKATGNSLERRTVDSTHISTISSLVDRTRCDSNIQMHESQKENFGLYALKYNRSSASRRGSVLKILTPNGGSPRRKLSTNSSAAAYNFKHEHFQPCRSAYDDNDSDASNDNAANEFCRIELSEGECLNGLKNSAARKNDKNCKNMKIQQSESESNGNDLAAPVPAPVPPRRVKSVPLTRPRADPLAQLKANLQFIDDETNNSKSSNQSESSPHQKAEVECSTVTQQHKMRSPRVQTIKSNASAIATENQSLSSARLARNKSELCRLGDSGENATNGGEDKNGNREPAREERCAAKRKLVRQSGPLAAKSRDIFAKADDSQAFSDFDEVIRIAPVVAVDRNSNYECGTPDAPTAAKSEKRVTLKGTRENGSPNKAFGRGRATVNISTDSNEIRIYSREHTSDDESDGAVVV